MKLEAYAGEHIEAYAKRMQDAYARQLHPATGVAGEFNGIDLTHGPGSTWEGTVDFFHKEQRRQAEEYRNSDEYKERQRRAEERESERKSALPDSGAAEMSKPDCWMTPDEIHEVNDNDCRLVAQICARLDRLIGVLERPTRPAAGSINNFADVEPHYTCAQCGETWEWHQAHHPRHQFERSSKDYP